MVTGIKGVRIEEELGIIQVAFIANQKNRERQLTRTTWQYAALVDASSGNHLSLG